VHVSIAILCWCAHPQAYIILFKACRSGPPATTVLLSTSQLGLPPIESPASKLGPKWTTGFGLLMHRGAAVTVAHACHATSLCDACMVVTCHYNKSEDI
jgi:hypothetical protein